MKRTLRILLPLWTLFFVITFQSAVFANETETNEARLYAGFDGYQRAITTDSAEAQALFDQGMQLMYGFNHDEAIRSFQAAAALDPASPMPWWGIAYSHGININDPEMGEARSKAAREAADEALKRLETGSSVEKALVQAVSARYEWPAPEDRFPLDQAYAEKMAEVYAAFPEDQDVGVLYAESLMDLQPWDYWDNDGKPRGRAGEMVEIVESVMEKNPNHPGANHFYIHAVEASKNPDRALSAAKRLESLVPGSGHLVHMPSHIYIRVGRYADAVDSNAQAVKADRAYFEKAPDPAMYAIYYAHNLHFLAYAAMMSGRYEDAINAARDLERDMPEEPLRAFAGLIEGIMPTTLHVLVRFGKWEQILEEPEYADYRLVSRAVRRYARSIAYSALGEAEKAHGEMAAFEEAIVAVPQDWYVFNNKVDTVLPIARAMMKGELLFSEGKSEEAFAVLRQGIEAEDALIYDEPPGWMLPVRHSLGALLMADDLYEEAEKVYREDLERNRENGWSLIGLQQALMAQDKPGEAGELSGRLATAWAKADTFPETSCFCGVGRGSMDTSEKVSN
jgi:tetratricopeptide (TPR) repeat protein